MMHEPDNLRSTAPARRNTIVIGARHGTVAPEGAVQDGAPSLERRPLVRIVVSIALIALLLWRIDLAAAGPGAARRQLPLRIPGWRSSALAKLLVAQRWRLMMSTFAGPAAEPLFGILLVSNLANNIVPARIGRPDPRAGAGAALRREPRAAGCDGVRDGVAARRHRVRGAGADRAGADRPAELPDGRVLGRAGRASPAD